MNVYISKYIWFKWHPYEQFSSSEKVQGFYVHHLGIMEWGLAFSPSSWFWLMKTSRLTMMQLAKLKRQDATHSLFSVGSVPSELETFISLKSCQVFFPQTKVHFVYFLRARGFSSFSVLVWSGKFIAYDPSTFS